MTDLSTLAYKPVALDILHPVDGLPIGLKLEVMHVDDPAMSSLKNRLKDAALKRNSKGKAPTSEQLEENKLQLLFAVTKGWTWYHAEKRDEIANWEGEQLEFTRSNFVLLCEKLPTFADQIDSRCGEIDGFI